MLAKAKFKAVADAAAIRKVKHDEAVAAGEEDDVDGMMQKIMGYIRTPKREDGKTAMSLRDATEEMVKWGKSAMKDMTPKTPPMYMNFDDVMKTLNGHKTKYVECILRCVVAVKWTRCGAISVWGVDFCVRAVVALFCFSLFLDSFPSRSASLHLCFFTARSLSVSASGTPPTSSWSESSNWWTSVRLIRASTCSMRRRGRNTRAYMYRRQSRRR